MVKRGDIWLVRLEPTLGSEIRKTRPCMIISPDGLSHLSNHVIAPLTSHSHPTRFQPAIEFEGKAGLILLDQIRTESRLRLVRRLGAARPEELAAALSGLREMFED